VGGSKLGQAQGLGASRESTRKLKVGTMWGQNGKKEKGLTEENPVSP
jgi:hypothetical protein